MPQYINNDKENSPSSPFISKENFYSSNINKFKKE